MPITIQVAGDEYTNFTSAEVNIALDTLANDFLFEAVMSEGEAFPIKVGHECVVLVDEVPVLTGFIESVGGSYSAESHIITVAGRDKTCDIIDSSIDVMDDLRAPISLKEICDKVIAHIGADIQVIDDAKPDKFNEAEDIVAPKPGDNAFEFIESYAQKRQVLLTSDASGNIVITNSKAVPSGAVLQNARNNDTNNVLSASWSSNSQDRFNKYIQKGQLDPVALSFSVATSADGVVSQAGKAVDAAIRQGRQLVSVADKGFSQDQLQLRAEWSKKIRRARSVVYSCTTHGFKNSEKNLWAVNTLATVFDEFADIDRALLLNSILFAYGEGGSTTSLGFVEANAYVLQTIEPKPVGKSQDAFSLL